MVAKRTKRQAHHEPGIQPFIRAWTDATKRMRSIPGGQLGWLLRFLDMDLDSLSEGQWLDLRFDLLAFPYEAPIMSGNAKPPKHDEVRKFQEEVRRGLHILLEGGTWEPKSVSLEIELQRIEEQGRTRIERRYKADWRAARLATVADLLAVRGERLRQCAECGKLFLAVKRQAYCDRRCSQITRTRRFREVHPTESYERRRRAYQRSMAREAGSTVSVRRLGPRKKS